MWYLVTNFHEKVSAKLSIAKSAFGRAERKGLGPLSSRAIDKVSTTAFVDFIISDLAVPIVFALKKVISQCTGEDDDAMVIV
jgi:hypothetical protein